MARPENYKTKQREAVFSYIVSLGGAHVTAAQIALHFEKEGIPIGRTTIYRQLDKLTENGKLRRYVTDGASGACYQYAGSKETGGAYLHLKCEGCGELLHLECEALDDLERHVFSDHAFRINALKTVLYGKCDVCIQKARQQKYTKVISF